MAYFIEILDGRIAGLYRDDLMAPPPGATQISDEDGVMLSKQSRFGDFELVDGTVVPAPAILSIADFERALDDHLDGVAKQYRWDNRFTFAMRAAYTNAWQTQAIAFGEWMDTCNLQAYQLLEAVVGGTAQPPASIAAFLATLPEFVLPA